MSGHRCAAPGCEVRIDDALLMCWRHWRLVPHARRAAVIRTWRELAARRSSAASTAYQAAREAAMAAVVVAEREAMR